MDELVIQINGISIPFHISVLTWLAICLVVSILLVVVGKQFKKADPTKVPNRVVLVFEQLINLCVGMVKSNLNEKTWIYLPFFGTLIFLMAFSNTIGLLGLQEPTSNLSINIALTMMFIVLIHYTDIKLHGWKGKWKSLCSPTPLLLPLNIIGDLALPISLTLRLFGNMLGGSIIMALFYLMIESFFPFSGVLFSVTPFLHMYLNIFTGLIQTYIFFMLTSYFLGDVLQETSQE